MINTIIIARKIRPTSQPNQYPNPITALSSYPFINLLLVDYSLLKRLLSMITKIRHRTTYLVTHFFVKLTSFIGFLGEKRENDL